MLRFAISLLLTALVASAPVRIAAAADAAALKVYGFSPDGRYFGFGQHFGLGDAGHAYAAIVVIDATHDRVVPGFPVRVEPSDYEGLAEAPQEGEAALKLAEKRAGTNFLRYGATQPGHLLAREAAVRASETPSDPAGTPHGPRKGAKVMTFTHPRLGRFDLRLALKPFDWPSTSRLGRHKEAALCKQEMDPVKGAGFRLTLTRSGTRLVLVDDKTIPASRLCALSYGLAEVHAFDRPDGAVTLAVILDMYTRGFEGEDRDFLAVTKVIGP